jgi:hypothetical protein
MRVIRHDREDRALERRLRRERPAPPARLLEALDAPARRTGRLGLVAALTAAMLVAVASVGGVGYAASSAERVVAAAKRAVTPEQGGSTIVVKGISAGGDQYRPGYTFGDPSHNHSGPPFLGGRNGEKTPPAQTRTAAGGKAVLVVTSVAVDEQAALYISVIDSHGHQLLLTQGGSTIGGAVSGPQAKTIHYVVLVPRTIPLQLRVPSNLLQPGETYRIRVIAVDADGNKSETTIPFAT